MSACWPVNCTCRYLQVLSACAMSFSHGSNDVANAIGSFSAALYTYQNSAVGARGMVSKSSGLCDGFAHVRPWLPSSCCLASRRLQAGCCHGRHAGLQLSQATQ